MKATPRESRCINYPHPSAIIPYEDRQPLDHVRSRPHREQTSGVPTQSSHLARDTCAPLVWWNRYPDSIGFGLMYNCFSLGELPWGCGNLHPKLFSYLCVGHFILPDATQNTGNRTRKPPISKTYTMPGREQALQKGAQRQTKRWWSKSRNRQECILCMRACYRLMGPEKRTASCRGGW